MKSETAPQFLDRIFACTLRKLLNFALIPRRQRVALFQSLTTPGVTSVRTQERKNEKTDLSGLTRKQRKALEKKINPRFLFRAQACTTHWQDPRFS